MVSQLPSFDVLMELARNNPEKLEEIRQQMSAEILADATPSVRAKLEGLNFRIDMERQRCKNPLQSCMRITALMHDSFDRMREELDILVAPQPPQLRVVNQSPINDSGLQEGNVVPFKRANSF